MAAWLKLHEGRRRSNDFVATKLSCVVLGFILCLHFCSSLSLLCFLFCCLAGGHNLLLLLNFAFCDFFVCIWLIRILIFSLCQFIFAFAHDYYSQLYAALKCLQYTEKKQALNYHFAGTYSVIEDKPKFPSVSHNYNSRYFETTKNVQFITTNSGLNHGKDS